MTVQPDEQCSGWWLDSRDFSFVAGGKDGPHQVLVVDWPHKGLRRLGHWLVLPFRIRLARFALRLKGIACVRVFACYPDAETSTLVYELASDAARYAETYLLPEGQDRRLRRLVAWWLGFDPAVGAIVLLGSDVCH